MRGGDQVAKLFASAGDRSSENDPIYKALSQCLGGLIQHRGAPALIKGQGGNVPPVVWQYPVIVCGGSGEFFKTDVATSAAPNKFDSNFLLEVNYAFLNINRMTIREYFLIDIVWFSRLEQLLAALDHEMENAKTLVID
jgi:hypothetical protein